MPWSEKFEETTLGTEKIVNVETDKHRHEAALITKIAKALGVKFGGTWTVRANSYQTKLSTNPNAVSISELDIS